MSPQERSVEVNGLRLAYRVYGEGAGPPVLCLHGWLDNAASFEPMAPHLQAMELIAVDLPGHGQSDHRAAGAAYHQLDWVRDVLALADTLGLERFALMGHSMGAAIASLCAGTSPERISRLVLIEGLGPRSVSAERLPELLNGHLSAQRKAQRQPVGGRPASFAIAVRARRAASRLSAEAAEILARRGTVPRGSGVIWNNDRRLHQFPPARMTEDQVQAFLSRIQAPTLLLRASAGMEADHTRSAERVACFADLQMMQLEGGHHLHMDHPESVAEPVARFLTARDS